MGCIFLLFVNLYLRGYITVGEYHLLILQNTMRNFRFSGMTKIKIFHKNILKESRLRMSAREAKHNQQRY